MKKRELYTNVLLHEVYSQFSDNALIKKEKTRILDNINNIWYFLNIRKNLTENDFNWINQRCVDLMGNIYRIKED